MLSIIVLEDFRFRAVHVLWFLGTGICGIGLGVWEYGVSEVWRFGLVNLLFVGIQMVLLTIWFCVKEGRLLNIADRYLGWGDIVFFVVLAFTLPTHSFILFYSFSLITVLTGFLIGRLLLFKNATTIPLAGGMAICLIGVLIASWFLDLEIAQTTLSVY